MRAARRVLLTAEGFYPESFGGGERYVGGVARELARRGHEVTVLARGGAAGGGEARARVGDWEGVRVVRLAIDREGASFAERATGEGPLLAGAVGRAIDEAAPQLVHVGGLERAAVGHCARRGLPHVLTAHHVGLVCPAGVLLRPGRKPCRGPGALARCVRCANRWRRPGTGAGLAIGLLPALVHRPLGRRILRKRRPGLLARGLGTPALVEASAAAWRRTLADARFIVAPSGFMRELLVGGGVDEAKITVLAHGVDATPRPPDPGGARRSVRFGYVGRIDPFKGLDVLLDAAALVGRGCEVHVFGAARSPRDDEYRRGALRRAAGRVAVTDHGLLPADRIAEAYATVDVVVVPSLVPEAFGLVVAEAFAAGRPVVVFDSGALAERVRDGIDGFVVPGRSVGALAAALRRFVDEGGLAGAMGGRVPRVPSVGEHVDALEALHARVLDG